MSGRDRLTIQLDGGEGETSLGRSGTHSLTLGLSAPPAQFSLKGAAPGLGSLVSNAQVRGQEIEVALRNPAFGYMVTRPGPRQIVIDIFPDPLGARWTPSGQLAPAPATPVASVAPVAPAPLPQTAAAQGKGSPASAPTPAPVPASATSISKASPPSVLNAGRSPALTPPAPSASPSQSDATAPAPSAVAAVQDAFSPESALNLPVSLSADDDSTLPEMPASGALRENPLPPAASPDASASLSAPSSSPFTPAELGDSAGRFLTDVVKGLLSLNAHASNENKDAPPDEGGRARILSPQNIRASVNSDGPEAWGTEDSLSTRLPVAAGVAKPAPLAVTAPASPPDANSEGGPRTPANAASSGSQASTAPRKGKHEVRQAITPPGNGPAALTAPATASSPPAPPASATPVPATASAPEKAPKTATAPTASESRQTVATPAPASPAKSPTTAPATSPSLAAPTPSPAATSQPAPTATVSAPPASAPATPAMPPASAAPATATAPATPPGDSQPQHMAETRQAATKPKSANATAVQGNATRPVVYVNEKGEVVPKPPEPDKMMTEAQALIDKSQFAEALPILLELKALPLDPAMHEKVLYHIMEVTQALYAGKALEGFEPLISAASEAMNANLRSSRVPDALFRLGMTHLGVGNISEAEGYFKALKRRFPYDINVPVAFKNLGVAQLKAGKNAQAVKTLQMIMQEYPETSVLREAAVALARALYAVDDLENMAVITDFIDKRWARHYVEDQDYLLLLARSQARMNRLESALQHYWLYYNLVPGKEGNDKVLAQIGDLYLRTGRLPAAKELFEEILVRYPQSDGAALAQLRLAERGIHDTPITIDEMFRVFVLSGEPKPPVTYRTLQRDYPLDPRTVVAGLKLAMWQLWNKEYTDAMGAAADFIDAYPEHIDVEQARQVIMRAFAEELKNSLAEENYGRILLLWNGFPLVRERYGEIDANMRHALARGYIERGDDEKALELLSEFLKTPKNSVYSDYAFTLFFNKYLQAADWNALLDLGELVKDWPMKPEMRSQLDYALALSSENLGLADKALPLWQQLAERTDIPLYEQAYATYFLAKDAERRRDIKAAYKFNLDTLKLFQRLQEERSDRADPDRIKEAMGSLMDITEVGNHIPEALEWVERYNQFVPEDSPEFPGLRFREARLYRKMGDNAKAKALLEQIVKKAPESPFGQAAAVELRTFEVSRDLRNFIDK